MHTSDTAENALVEISLALAMGFFSLLIVALVSMAAPHAQGSDAPDRQDVPEIAFDAEPAAAPAADDAPRVVMHYANRWFDASGQPLEVASMTDDGRRLVLALAPDVTLVQARQAQARVAHVDPAPSLTTLPLEWIEELENQP